MQQGRPFHWTDVGVGASLLLSGLALILFAVLFAKWKWNALIRDRAAQIKPKKKNKKEDSSSSSSSDSEEELPPRRKKKHQ